MGVTLKDIAGKAGVTATTVSDILNKRPKCFASPETKKRVFSIAKSLRYRPNFIAKSLRGKNTATIGLIMGSFDVEVTVAKARDIENMALKRGFHVYIGHTNGDAKMEEEYIDSFIGRQVEGLIIIQPTSQEEGRRIWELAGSGFPVVLVDPAAGMENISSVTVDRRWGAYEATKHLLELGHRDIGIWGEFVWEPGRERLRGYKDALAEYGAGFSEKRIYSGLREYSTGYSRMKDILSETDRPSAFLATNDEVAIGAMKCVRDSGRRVPGDISFVGFDDIKGAEFSHPPLTTVRQPTVEVGRTALELLFEKIRNPEKCAARQVLLKPELIIRESTGKSVSECEKSGNKGTEGGGAKD